MEGPIRVLEAGFWAEFLAAIRGAEQCGNWGRSKPPLTDRRSGGRETGRFLEKVLAKRLSSLTFRALFQLRTGPGDEPG